MFIESSLQDEALLVSGSFHSCPNLEHFGELLFKLTAQASQYVSLWADNWNRRNDKTLSIVLTKCAQPTAASPVAKYPVNKGRLLCPRKGKKTSELRFPLCFSDSFASDELKAHTYIPRCQVVGTPPLWHTPKPHRSKSREAPGCASKNLP